MQHCYQEIITAKPLTIIPEEIALSGQTLQMLVIGKPSTGGQAILIMNIGQDYCELSLLFLDSFYQEIIIPRSVQLQITKNISTLSVLESLPY